MRGGTCSLTAQHFQALFEATPDPCLVLDRNLQIAAVNEAYLRATMAGRAEIVGRSLLDVMPDDPDDPLVTALRNLTASLQRVLKKGVTEVTEVQRYDIRVPAVQGGVEEPFWSVLVVPVPGNGEDILYIIHRTQEVTPFFPLQQKRAEQGEGNGATAVAETLVRSPQAAQVSLRLKHAYAEQERRNEKLREVNRCLRREAAARRQVEDALHNATLELERSNRELDLFASVISHDLQAPLRTITSYTQLLQAKYQETLDTRGIGYVRYIVDGAVRMRTMINDLLSYSRVSTRAGQFQPVKMDLVLDQALGNLGSALVQSNTTIRREQLPEVEGELSQLTQLMQNLIANAVTFRRKEIPPEIEISCRRSGQEWVFGVSDNGIGIEPHFFENVFEPFRRLHTREEYEGSGMGLPICRKIVERHGGRIWVESVPGQGSTFFFTIPCREKTGDSHDQRSLH